MTVDNRPWYKQPLLWWVLSPLAVTVVAGLWLIMTATEIGGVDALPGEYGKAGKLLALDEAALERSAALAPLANGVLSSNRIRLEIDADGLPEALRAHLIHATLPARDVTVTLTWTGDAWLAALPTGAPDRGELHVYPDDRSWRLVAPIAFDSQLAFAASRR